jgi:hypothetical protein
MLVEHGDVEVHYATFEKLSKDISAISRFASQQNASIRPIAFHALKGPSLGKAMSLRGYDIGRFIHGPGVSGLAQFLGILQDALMPWTGPEYLGLYQEILALFDEIDPLVVVVEPTFGPGVDAARAQGRNYAIVSPNSMKDNFAPMQPWGSWFWKYPA